MRVLQDLEVHDSLMPACNVACYRKQAVGAGAYAAKHTQLIVSNILCVDRYSCCLLVGRLGKASSANEIIKMLQRCFPTFSYAMRARHDGGPEFRRRLGLAQASGMQELGKAIRRAMALLKNFLWLLGEGGFMACRALHSVTYSYIGLWYMAC